MPAAAQVVQVVGGAGPSGRSPLSTIGHMCIAVGSDHAGLELNATRAPRPADAGHPVGGVLPVTAHDGGHPRLDEMAEFERQASRP
jgi:hypothetical protein